MSINQSKYSLEIDVSGIEATGYEDKFNFVSYGMIATEGNSLKECLENASVDLVDQDGGEADMVEADEEWMQIRIEEEFMKKYSPEPEGAA